MLSPYILFGLFIMIRKEFKLTEHIKINSIPPRIQYIGNGTNTTFDFPFAIFKNSDLKVYFENTLQSADSYTIEIDTDNNCGTVKFQTPPASGTAITLNRELAIERTSDFQEGSTLRANVLNDELDYQIACQQQIADNLNRSMVLPPYAVSNNINLTLPTPSAGKAIVWNSDGTNLENSTVSVNALEDTLNGYKTDAETAASTAIAKAEIAADAASTATTQADIATTKAQEATSVLSSKANTDADNLTSVGKETIVGLCMPDYTAGISVSLPFTATCDGVLKVNTNGYWYGYINNSDYSHGINVISISGGDQTSDFILPKGTVISLRAVSGTNTLTFYPMKGV